MSFNKMNIREKKHYSDPIQNAIDKIYFSVPHKIGDKLPESKLSFEKIIKTYIKAQCDLRETTTIDAKSKYGKRKELTKEERMNIAIDSMNAMRDLEFFIKEKCCELRTTISDWEEQCKVLGKFLSLSFPKQLSFTIGINPSTQNFINNILQGISDHVTSLVASEMSDHVPYVTNKDAFSVLYETFCTVLEQSGGTTSSEDFYRIKELHFVYHLIRTSISESEFNTIINKLCDLHLKKPNCSVQEAMQSLDRTEYTHMVKAFYSFDASFLIVIAHTP